MQQNDFNQQINNLKQYASGFITYNVPTPGVKASGLITIVDNTKLSTVVATLTIVVTDFTQLAGTTVTVDGVVLTEGVNWNAAVSNDATATSLSAAIDALVNVNSSAATNNVLINAALPGVAGNLIGVSTNAVAGLTIPNATLQNGRDATIINVNGTALTAGVDFVIGGNANITATNLAVAADAVATVGATANNNVVTVTADDEGTAGNAKTLATSYTAAATVSGGTLSGGVNGDTIVVNGNTFTCVQNAPGANEFSNATELKNLIDGLANINASVATGVITINADAPGIAGNAVTLALGVGNTGTLAISGATLSGGVDATYSDVYTMLDETQSADIDVTASVLNGTNKLLTVTVQFSEDKQTWFDKYTLGQLSATGTLARRLNTAGLYMRLKFVLAGINTVATFKVWAQGRDDEAAEEQTALSTSKGKVTIPNTAGGTQIIGANQNRVYCLIQNKGGVSIYIGAGTVTSDDIELVANGEFKWESTEPLNGLSSGADCTVKYIDYIK